MKIKDSLLHYIGSKDSMPSDKTTQQILSSVGRNSSLIDIYEYLNTLPELSRISSSVYVDGDRYYLMSPSSQAENIVDVYKRIEPLKMECSPDLVATKKSLGNYYGMVVLDFPPLDKEHLSYQTNNNMVSVSDKAQFLGEITDMAHKLNSYNPQIIDDMDSLFLTKKHKILVPNWNELKTFSSCAEKKDYLSTLKKLLGLN